MELEAAAAVEPERDFGRWPLAAGVASALLLAACVKWAHHFGVRTDLLIAAWAVTTLAALVTSLLSHPRGRGARFGLMLALVSVVALALAGVAFAIGDPPNSCGGG